MRLWCAPRRTRRVVISSRNETEVKREKGMSHDLQPELQWITRIAAADSLLVGGENPGYGIPPSLNTFYTNTNTTTTMMASALRMAKSCNFTIFYWAHDIHLHDGTLPFTLYTTDIATIPG